MEIAWIGTGIMGAPMARNLMRAGHRLRLYNRTAKRAATLAAEGSEVIVAADPAAAASGAEAVFFMVPDTPDVEKVLFGASGVAEGLTRGKTVVDMSSISPMATKDYAPSRSWWAAPRRLTSVRSRCSRSSAGASLTWGRRAQAR